MLQAIIDEHLTLGHRSNGNDKEMSKMDAYDAYTVNRNLGVESLIINIEF